MRKIALVLSLFYCVQLNAQSTGYGKLKVYIDCNRTSCDKQYIRSEITVVDFLLDRLAADVHVLITAQRVGSGGHQYQLIFYGQHRFKRYIDTLRFITGANATPDEVRKQLVRYLMIGLTPLIARTDYASAISIDLKKDSLLAERPQDEDHDRWNYWVFNVGMNGDLSSEQSYKTNRLSASFSADRTTDKLKVNFYMYGSRRNSIYTIEDSASTSKYTVKNSDYGFFHHLVKSISAHWSYGYQTSFTSNTYTNFQHKIYFNPAIEYNFFKYQEVNNRFFVVRYGLDVSQNNYFDTTIYNKTKETLLGHKFSGALTFNKKWGNINWGIYYRNYFNDWKLNSMGMNFNANIRITGGLSFSFYASGSIVHDQVYLVKGAATEQEVLTRQRQLASSYNYYTSFGINYRFGSKLNNFVNPRFEGYGGF